MVSNNERFLTSGRNHEPDNCHIPDRLMTLHHCVSLFHDDRYQQGNHDYACYDPTSQQNIEIATV